MVLSFAEEQAIEIRETGVSVIKFKYFIKNTIPHIIHVLGKMIDVAKKMYEILKDIFRCIRNVFDDVRYAFEQTQDCFGYPVSARYRFVKFLGYMGYRKYDMWILTRRYMTRSDC